MENSFKNEVDDWLEETKKELLLNVEVALGKHLADRETLEIMKNLIQTIRAVPKEKK